MADQEKLLPIRIELDQSDLHMTPDTARIIKNLTFFRTDTSQPKTGKYRPLEATVELDPTFSFPSGYNHRCGFYSARDENFILFLNYNENNNHGLYKINADTEKVETVYLKSCLNVQLNPENFLHEGGGFVEVFEFTDPTTGLPRKRSYFNFTDGFNDMRFICIEDSIATGSFDKNLFQYFINPHPECLLINAGVPTPDCPTFSELPNTDPSLPNNLKFKTFRFRVRYIDVYGRPSEYGIISELYVPGTNDCIGSSILAARCLELSFDAGNALINAVDICFQEDNGIWYKDTTIFLYKGSNLGDWWLRERNLDVTYDPVTNQIKYNFCKEKECNPISTALTNRTQNPIPRKCQSVNKLGNILGAGNNTKGFNPLQGDVLSQLERKITPPTGGDSQLRNIEIFVPIYNLFEKTYQPVFKTDTGVWAFGGRRSFSNSYTVGLETDYKQAFGDDDRRGFIGYLAGTSNTTVSELYYVNETTNEFIKVEDFNIVHTPAINGPIFSDYRRRWYIKFTFNNIAPAKYIFRIAGHGASLSDANYQNTSTYVGGQFSWLAKQTDFNNKISNTPELVIDVCTQNYNSLDDNRVLVIYDLTSADVGSDTHPASGYIYEKKEDDVYTFPIELLKVQILSFPLFPQVYSAYTDHNGFYFIGTKAADYAIHFYGHYNCTYDELLTLQVGDQNRLYEQNKAMSETEDFSDYNQLPCNRIFINVSVQECGSGIPVPGVGVTLSRGRTAVTGANGIAIIIAHDYSASALSVRNDKLYYTPTVCAFKGCSDVCVTPFDINITPCISCNERVIDAALAEVMFEILRGLLSGGRYAATIWGCHDWLGRHTFTQISDQLYFTVPTLIETKKFAPSLIQLIIPPSVTFPPEFDYITVGITKELRMGGIYLDWIVDDVKFIDNTGNENDIAPTQIKIYYGSLIEYNKQNNFNTTVEWQFIVQDDQGVNTNVNYTSDYVEFYLNGDGTFFPTLIRALVKYDQTGQYFLIDYDSALKDLKKFALMRLCRPLQCATQDLFFELCGKIKLVNGKPETNTIDITAFDTYYKYRQIPIPIGTEEDPENIVRNFGFPFEHHSPSDFWGLRCWNIGRQNATNPFESEITIGDEVRVSGVLSDNGQLNFFNFFDDALVKVFKVGLNIVAMLPQTGVIAFICEEDVFKAGYGDNLLRFSDGKVQVLSGDNLFGEPERKFGKNYGCSLFDKNTIRIKEGLIEFLCSKQSALIQYDYSDINIVSRIDIARSIVGGIDTFLRQKVKSVYDWNKHNSNKRYFTAVVNPATKEYLLTDYLIRSNNVVNNSRDYNIETSETIAFDYRLKIFRGPYSFTPEMYADIESETMGLQLFSFALDKVWKHYSNNPEKNVFYGTPCEIVVRVVYVRDNFVKKKFEHIAVYCPEKQYWSDQVLTDSKQRSRLLKAAWKQGQFMWSAGFQCNLDTPADPNLVPQTTTNKLFDGNVLYGSIIDVRFILEVPNSNVDSSLLGFTVDSHPSEKYGV